MKIRTGFVSNSSSSSYVLIGKRIRVKDLKKAKNPVYIMYSPGGSNGEYANRISDDDIDLFLSHKKVIENDNEVKGIHMEIYDAFYFGEEDRAVSTKGIPKTVEIITFERDHHSPDYNDLERLFKTGNLYEY